MRKDRRSDQLDVAQDRRTQLGLVLASVFLAQLALFIVVVLFFNGLRTNLISHFAGFSVGFDYPFYYRAAQQWLSGGNPYTEINALPLSIMSGALFLKLPMQQAYRAYQLLNIVALSSTAVWFGSKIGLTRSNNICFLLTVLTFAPTYSALVGGNIDVIMLAILFAACCIENRWGRAFLLAASVWTKLYSALISVELVIAKRWRLILAISVMLVLVGLPFLPLLTALPSSLHTRVGWFKTSGNISPAAIFVMLIGEKHHFLWQFAYFAFWGGTLLIASLTQRKRSESEIITGCAPWMISIPPLVGFYSGVMLLPVAARLIRTNQDRPLQFYEKLSVLGILLVGIYPLAFVYVLPLSTGQYAFLRNLFLPGGAAGMTLLLASIALQGLRKIPQPN